MSLFLAGTRTFPTKGEPSRKLHSEQTCPVRGGGGSNTFVRFFQHKILPELVHQLSNLIQILTNKKWSKKNVILKINCCFPWIQEASNTEKSIQKNGVLYVDTG